MSTNGKAKFIEPMLLLRTEKQPEGDGLLYELKLDGYRAVAFKTGGKVHLRSRNNKDFSTKYPAIVKALAAMPDDTVIDVCRTWRESLKRCAGKAGIVGVRALRIHWDINFAFKVFAERRQVVIFTADLETLLHHDDGSVFAEPGDCGFTTGPR